jgi:hypothetical protein
MVGYCRYGSSCVCPPVHVVVVPLMFLVAAVPSPVMGLHSCMLFVDRELKEITPKCLSFNERQKADLFLLMLKEISPKRTSFF